MDKVGGETKKPKEGGGNLIYRYKFRFIMFLPVGVSEKRVAKRCYISAGMSDVCLSVWPYLKTHTRKLHETFRCSVAAIQVVQVVRCTRAHDPWGPTSEDQIAIFLKN